MIRSLALAGALTLAFAGGIAATAPASAQQTGASRGDVSERVARRFKQFDRNGDGYIDKDELEQRSLRSFRKLDRNGDGAIDRDEMSAKSGRRKAGRNTDRMAKRLQRLDSNRDGRVTQEEYLAKTPRWFTRGDADKDGRVSRQEYEDFMADQADRRARRAGRKKNDM